jgi:hypothetical protein
MKPICTVTGLTSIGTCNVTMGHDMSSSTAVIETDSIGPLAIGNEISIAMGYAETGTDTLFKGYIKAIERQVQSQDSYTITANDYMVRAVDYFIASADPNAPFSRHNINAEDLIRDLLALAGLTNYDYQATSFIIATVGNLEVNLTSDYDYCKMIGDLIAWHLWTDEHGVTHFRNRKPYVMYGTSSQPGDVADVPIAYTLTDALATDITYGYSEKDLRNKVVVYGQGCQATASASSPYLPAGYYKTVVAGATLLLDSQIGVQKCADYNLALLNRLTYSLEATAIGDPILKARKVILVDSSKFGISNEKWYIHDCQHNFSPTGYTTSLSLRK